MAFIRDDDSSHVLFGTAGDDVIFGNGGKDTINGGDGNDRIIGGSGLDVVRGGAGDDTFVFYGASDIYYLGEAISGGTGFDTLLLSSAGSTGALQVGFYDISFLSIERIQLSSGSNDVTANFNLDSVHAAGFSTQLEFVGGAGKDKINFLLGEGTHLDLRGATFTNWHRNDELNFQVNGPQCTFGGTDQADHISVDPGAWGSLVKGNGGDDVFRFMISALVTIDGGAGEDCIVVNDFGDFSNQYIRLNSIEVIRFEDPTQTSQPYAWATFDSAAFDYGIANPFLHFVDASNALPSAVSIWMNEFDGDTCFSAAGFTFENWNSENYVFIVGNSLGDTIVGSAVNDQIYGYGGDDVLRGASGDDILVGSIGADQLNGGAGNDTFAFTNNADSGVGAGFRDRILDFGAGDKIDLSALDASASLAGDQAFVLDTDGMLTEGEIQFSGHLNTAIRINLDADPEADMEIVLRGIAPGLLTANDFVL